MKHGTAWLWSFGLLMLPGTALAAWGENWGEMVWALPVSVPSIEVNDNDSRITAVQTEP